MTSLTNTILVTGAAGFIGSHLVQELLAHNQKVIGLDNFSSGRQENLDCINKSQNSHNFRLIEGDIRHSDTCQTACENCDSIIHLAGLASVPESINFPDYFHEVNVGGTQTVLKMAVLNNVKKFIFASSSAIYGNNPNTPLKESHIPIPLSPYAQNKLDCEQLLNEYKNDIDTLSLRFFNVFGTRQDPTHPYASVIPIFISKIKNNISPTIYGNGEQIRDFIYVKTVVSILRKLILSPFLESGLSLNLGSGYGTTINELKTLLLKINHVSLPFNYAPAREGEIIKSISDNSLLKEWINKSLDFNFETALQETSLYY